MKEAKVVHYYIRKLKKKVEHMSIARKRLILVGAGALLAGLMLGNMMGHSFERKKAETQIKQAVAEAQKEERKKTAEAKKEIEALKKETEEFDNNELPWNLILVNEMHPMEAGYVPELTQVEPNYSVDSRVAEPLQEMLAAASADGMHIIICSAYRSIDKQVQVFNTSVKERLNAGMSYWGAFEDTSKSVAIPGTSEHGIGLAVDLISNQYTGLDAQQAETPEAKWLEANCYKYGFILRYPPEKTHETGIIYEPWHYRYVGKEDAEKIMTSGITLEEYVHEMR